MLTLIPGHAILADLERLWREGLPDRGVVAPGLWADLAIWDAESPAELIYRLGQRPLHARIHGGHWC